MNKRKLIKECFPCSSDEYTGNASCSCVYEDIEENVYTEEEVKSLITEAFNDAFTYGHYDEQYVFIDGEKIDNDAEYWIKQNLNQNKDE
jgi:hypothetical protein